MNTLVKNKEGYAIRFYSNETQPDDDGIQVSARRGYVLSPCLYPEPLAKAIVPLIQKADAENTYFHFWLPNLDEMYADITKQKLHTKSIEDFYFIHDLPEKIGDDWESKPAIVGILENGSLSVENPLKTCQLKTELIFCTF
jgi:hypothetical protein